MEQHKDEPRPEFKPVIYYNEDGDGFELYWEADACYVECIGGGIELCRENETRRVVGVKFWGVKNRMGLRRVE